MLSYAKAIRTMLKRFAPGNLGTGERVILSCGQNQLITIHSIWLSNTHSGNVNYTFHHVPSGATPGIQNSLAYNVILRPQNTVIYDTPIYMEPGDKFTAHASTSGHISMFVYADVIGQ